MSPLEFLALTVLIPAVALTVQRWARRRAQRGLRALAMTWRMHYADLDRFDLTPRVAAGFPMPGAADLVITDVIYSLEGDHYRYLFTAIYTKGVVRTKHRIAQATTCREAREGRGPGALSDLRVAAEGVTIPEQYAQLKADVDASAVVQAS